MESICQQGLAWPVKREPGTYSDTMSNASEEVIDQPVTDTIAKLEHTEPEGPVTVCSAPSRPAFQDSEIMDVKLEVGIKKSTSPKSGLNWEWPIKDEMECADIPWQVYKDGEFLRHIWEPGSSRNHSGMGTPSIHLNADSNVMVDQPENGWKRTFDQSLGTDNVNVGTKSSPTVMQQTKHVTVVEVKPTGPDQLLHCQFCELSFKDHYLMEVHMRNHKSVKHHRCLVCEYSCTSKSQLSIHMRIHTGEKPYKCEVCQFRFTKHSSLTRHTRTHTGEKPFKCPLCEHRCAGKSQMTAHVRIHTGEKPYMCNLCDYRGVTKTCLTVHMRSHTGEKPFKCDLCDYRAVTRSHLTVHMRTHTGEKPYMCTSCKYRCTSKCLLTQHMKTHSGEKHFKCPVCEYTCARKCQLTVHVGSHSGEKPFVCTWCEYKCVTNSQLINHMQTHTA